MKDKLQNLFQNAIDSLKDKGTLPDSLTVSIHLERSKNTAFGDMSSNLAMVLAKQARMPPRELAQRIIDHMPDNDIIDHIDIAGPGFMNIFLGKATATAIVQQILSEGNAFGQNGDGENQPVLVEFVSANPTGPLHIGHGRGAAVGDALCRLLAANGWHVSAEFYYNDAGVQIETLALSTQARCKGLTPDHADWPESAGYLGDYIQAIADAYQAKASVSAKDITVTAKGDIHDLDAIKAFAVAYLRHEQDLDLQAFLVNFDNYFLESSLYTDGKVDACVNTLIDNKKTYEKDGALWLETTAYGDDKDRVMRKSDGHFTYFVPDVAYHLDKWQRGFKRVINEQGADHHGTIARVRAGIQALDAGIPKQWPEYILHQMVLVMKNGKEVKLSKRAGSYVTLRDLINEVGCDATRYFLASRRADAQLIFDIDLAKSKSNENPVYYIQYAHARAASVLTKLNQPDLGQANLSLLVETEEKALLKSLANYPELIRSACARLEPHQISLYLKSLASEFHGYYNAHKILLDDAELSLARAALARSVKQVIFNGLELLGVNAPDKM